MKRNFKIIIAIVVVFCMILCFAGCKGESKEDETVNNEPSSSEAVVTTEEPTTEAPTTEAPTTEATTAPDGSSIKHIVDTLESGHFYMAGTMELRGGEIINTKVTNDGENSRLEMDSNKLKMSIIYLDGVPYVVNNATNTYVVFDEAAINSLDTVMKSISSMGISMNSADMNEMKSMMKNFDKNMDYSQYINNGEYTEYNLAMDNVMHLCSNYKTEYGQISIYTLDGELKYIEVYDASGLRQMCISVSAFIPQALTPITLNGLTKSASIVNLFTTG